MKFVATIAIFCTLFGVPFAPILAQTADTPIPLGLRPFDPNYILDDFELTQSDALSREAIARFLSAQTGTLGTYRTIDVDGVERSAADIIWRAAANHGISPQVLIVLLQKEQSLIEDSTPTQRQYDWATGYAVCDACSTDDPAIQKFKGFANQVDRAAARQRYYLEHPNEFNVRVGQINVIDGISVVPVNQATANLYIYTPHLHGNENFWVIWQRYFSRVHPDGTILADATTGEVWLLQQGQRRKFLSPSTLYADYPAQRIITIAHLDLQRYDVGTPIRFPAYSLLRSPKGTVYLLVNEQRRGIVSREVFRQLGYNPEEVIDATWTDLEAYPEGAPITQAAQNPQGELWQDSKTGGITYVVSGVRHPIWSREIFQSRFLHYPIRSVTTATLDALPLGEPAQFKDGTLVTASGNSAVYVISNGLKRPIANADVFTTLGYQWDTIIRTTPRALEAHPEGLPVTT